MSSVSDNKLLDELFELPVVQELLKSSKTLAAKQDAAALIVALNKASRVLRDTCTARNVAQARYETCAAYVKVHPSARMAEVEASDCETYLTAQRAYRAASEARDAAFMAICRAADAAEAASVVWEILPPDQRQVLSIAGVIPF